MMILLIYVIGIGNLVLTIFLALKANRGEMHKLPLVGDWAMHYAQRRGGGTGPNVR